MFPLLACSLALSAPPGQEPRDGWLKLFDGETLFGWKTEGAVAVRDGELVLGGDGKSARIDWRVRFTHPEIRIQVTAAEPRRGPHPRLRYGTGMLELGAVPLNNVTVPFSKSPYAIALEVPAGTVVRVKELSVRQETFTPLLNGRDLTGWKQFTADPKRNQATFTVTPAGELHILGGPGDLQSEAQFANFVLQGEFKTANAKVNSGIFFRCIPGEYQNGYECQIQNATIDNDPTRPLDAGTGAIYRRVPARKVVSKDNEWFALTLVADGPNICTWVNGEPVVAWTDERTPDANPRKGLRTEAGPISLQGHNPPMAADVLIRNLRIAGWE